MSDPYDPALRKLMCASTASVGVALHEGVYCGLLGPTCETPFESPITEFVRRLP